MKSSKCSFFLFASIAILCCSVTAAFADYATYCEDLSNQQVKTSVFNSYCSFDLASGEEKGLGKNFCLFESKEHMAMISLATLASKRPSIAATYLLKGVKLAALPKPVGDENPGTVFCKALEGTSLSRYTDGGFVTPGGEDEVCVFGDGSMVSIWAIVYVSEDSTYLGLRDAINSEPLNLSLPYMRK